MNILGKKIKIFRENKGLLIRQLASKIDLDPSIISKIESGSRLPSVVQLKKICYVLEIEENILINEMISEKILEILKESDTPFEVLNYTIDKLKDNVV